MLSAETRDASTGCVGIGAQPRSRPSSRMQYRLTVERRWLDGVGGVPQPPRNQTYPVMVLVVAERFLFQLPTDPAGTVAYA